MFYSNIKTKNKICVSILLSSIAIPSFFLLFRSTHNLTLSGFITLAVTLTFFYTFYGEAIFDWHADPNVITYKKTNGATEEMWVDKRKELKDKEKNKEDAPAAWVIERYIHRFLGLVLGWAILFILLDKRLSIFTNPTFNNLGWPDLILFIGGWIGINGRLPTIAHDVQNWFSRK